MSAQAILAMTVTMLALSAAPGPSDFAIVGRALATGFGSALPMILGIVAADLVFILLAALGLNNLAEVMGPAFVWIKLLGASYLFWLVVQLCWPQPATAPTLEKTQPAAGFLGGFLITLSDPRAVLFYMGLLPAFVNLKNITTPQIAIVMLIASGVILFVKCSYAALAGRASHWLGTEKSRRRLNWLAAVMLSLTGFFLLVETMASMMQ